MDKILLAHLDALESSVSTLITSLTTTNTFSTAPNAAQSILLADESLQQALRSLKQHQDNYQRILQLRIEAETLHDQLKDVVKTCVRYRTEIGEIHPSILEDEEEDDDNEEEDAKGEAVLGKEKTIGRDIDYDTLLSFAARIGKHNALAARAAEEESVQRREDARRKREEARAKLANGQNQSQSQTQSQTQQTPYPTTVAAPSQPLTQESAANLAAIDEQLSAAHAYNGMAFPAPEVLRIGALGQLQLLREQSGEDAVMQEVERLVGISELGMSSEESEKERSSSLIPGLTAEKPVETKKAEEKERQKPRQSSTGAAAAAPPPPKRKAVSLDFPESDEEDED